MFEIYRTPQLFKIRSYYLKAHKRSHCSNGYVFDPSEKATDYAIPGCGTYALRVMDESVQGIISKKRFDAVTKKVWIQRFSLEQLRKIISTWN